MQTSQRAKTQSLKGKRHSREGSNKKGTHVMKRTAKERVEKPTLAPNTLITGKTEVTEGGDRKTASH